MPEKKPARLFRGDRLRCARQRHESDLGPGVRLAPRPPRRNNLTPRVVASRIGA